MQQQLDWPLNINKPGKWLFLSLAVQAHNMEKNSVLIKPPSYSI